MDKQLPKFSVFKVKKSKQVCDIQIGDSNALASGSLSEEYYFSTKELSQHYVNQYKYVVNINCTIEEIKVNEEGILNGEL